MATTGYIYIALNASMPGILKVGKTSRPPEQRTAELSAPTGVPCDFVVAFDIQVTDIDEAEKRVHATFASYRVNKNREFFRVGVKPVISVLTALEREFPVQLPKQTPVCSGSIEELIFGIRSSGFPSAVAGMDNGASSQHLKEARRYGTSELHRAFVDADAALESGDVEAMIAASKRLGGSGETVSKLLLEAAKRGRADVCGDLARLWPENGVNLLQKLSLFWIAASAGDESAGKELSSYWHLLPPASKEQMRHFARKLNPQFECKDL
jgi:hypothetical protein